MQVTAYVLRLARSPDAHAVLCGLGGRVLATSKEADEKTLDQLVGV
jgi:hypothetical protein